MSKRETLAAENHRDKNLILVADGLGYGDLAEEASPEAVRVCRENVKQGPKAILEKAYPALKNTRGAAAAIAQIDRTQQTVCFAGIGNISGVVVTDRQTRSLVSYNGTVGHLTSSPTIRHGDSKNHFLNLSASKAAASTLKEIWSYARSTD